MKKIVIFLVVALVSSNSRAFEDLRSTPTRSISECQDNDHFLDIAGQPADEYNHTEEMQQDIDEYDQNVSDNVQPPTISPAKEMLARVLGSLLVRYISMREIARAYCKEFKDIIAKWYGSIVKA